MFDFAGDVGLLDFESEEDDFESVGKTDVDYTYPSRRGMLGLVVDVLGPLNFESGDGLESGGQTEM